MLSMLQSVCSYAFFAISKVCISTIILEISNSLDLISIRWSLWSHWNLVFGLTRSWKGFINEPVDLGPSDLINESKRWSGICNILGGLEVLNCRKDMVRWCYSGLTNFKSSKQYFITIKSKFLFVYNSTIVCS